jgi:hypothetical protein
VILVTARASQAEEGVQFLSVTVKHDSWQFDDRSVFSAETSDTARSVAPEERELFPNIHEPPPVKLNVFF